MCVSVFCAWGMRLGRDGWGKKKSSALTHLKLNLYLVGGLEHFLFSIYWE